MGMDISRGRWKNLEVTVRSAKHSFSQEQAAAHGWSGYGDPEYVPHECGIIPVAVGLPDFLEIDSLSILQKVSLEMKAERSFWSWYGFTDREEWCACFVSWCADQAGLIQSGAVPKFSLCTDGKNWFQNQGNAWGAGGMPNPVRSSF